VSLAAAPSIDHRARWPRARALYLLRVFTIATRSFRAALTLSRFRHDEFDRITGGDDRPKHQPPAASALLTFRVNMVFGCTSTAEEDDTRTLGRNDRAVDPSRRFLRMGSKRKRERERERERERFWFQDSFPLARTIFESILSEISKRNLVWALCAPRHHNIITSQRWIATIHRDISVARCSAGNARIMKINRKKGKRGTTLRLDEATFRHWTANK